MATVELYWPYGIDMSSSQTQYGTVTYAGSTQLIIQVGSDTAIYNGYGFTYNTSAGTVTGGTLTGYESYVNGVAAVSVSNLSLSAPTVAYYVQNNLDEALFSIALSGNDSIYGSPGNDTINAYGGTNYVDGGGGINTEQFSGNLSQYSFNETSQGLVVSGEGAVDTLVSIQYLEFSDQTIAAPCFVAGSRIITAIGAVPVEQLRIGQMVRTVGNTFEPIVWLGHRHVSCEDHPCPTDVWPVCMRANALGDGKPERDIWLSPDHAVYIGQVLIPIRQLINGATIVQEPRAEVEYWHVELQRHSIILVEGLPVESYLDTGNREKFSNGARIEQLYPGLRLRTFVPSMADRVNGGRVPRAA